MRWKAATRQAIACFTVTMAFSPALADPSQGNADARRRSKAIFERMATVLQHPRCMNCHTNGGFPRQGDDRHPHIMAISRGPGDDGPNSLQCASCHQSANDPSSGLPGAPDWHLAPLRMGWEGLNPGRLCQSIRDPRRGAMQPAGMIAHFHTGLVRWAWSPGRDLDGRRRTSPAIGYEAFLRLTRMWIRTGAACPD